MSGGLFYETPANLWKVDDIAKLAGTEEGVHLEFKKPSEFIKKGVFARDLFATELTETVSAFLNSDGGVILLGIQTDKHESDKKTELLKSFETWSPDQTFEHLDISLTASQIRDLIYGNIVPKPVGIEVKDLEVPTGNGTTTVFVVTVAPSPLGAHQSVKTLRYHRRTSDGDEPMLDFEIRAVNNRRAGPLLDLACKVTDEESPPFEEEWKKSSVKMERGGSEEDGFYRVNLIIATSNLGLGTADIARFDIGIPVPWVVKNYAADGTNAVGHWVPNSGLRYLIDSQVTVFWTPGKYREIPRPDGNEGLSERKVVWQQAIYAGNESPAHPIWPVSGRIPIGALTLQRQINVNVKPFTWLPWRAFSGEMPETRGAVLLIEEANYLYVFNYEMDEVCWWHHAEEEAKFEELKQRFHIR